MRCSTFIPASRHSALALLLLYGAAAAADDIVRIPLRIGAQVFQAEIADTPPARERGLMGRTQLAVDCGMLFVFDYSDRHCFWMRNTPLPLSIAFIDTHGSIVSLADMQPHTDTLHCPAAAARYALEVPQGTFQRLGVSAGARVNGLPR